MEQQQIFELEILSFKKNIKDHIFEEPIFIKDLGLQSSSPSSMISELRKILKQKELILKRIETTKIILELHISTVNSIYDETSKIIVKYFNEKKEFPVNSKKLYKKIMNYLVNLFMRFELV